MEDNDRMEEEREDVDEGEVGSVKESWDEMNDEE
jgi:hypothetical protein